MATSKMNLADPELELVDPTPNVHSLFVHFDSVFFWAALAGRALVRWSKRMYSCAGVCSYEGRNGICDIALSEPLLKLRPRKDLVETLLHEMIHAFLFITSRDNDRDGHGPNFKAHMHRINKAAGLNISIYHDFHDEVELYLRHWWRCNGPCQTKKPYFGVVRRYLNKPPGPSDYWWNMHRRSCGGTFIKIKEPENVKKPTVKKPRAKENPKDGMKQKVLDIYINTGKEITTTIDKDKQMKKVPPLTIHNGQTNRKSLETNSVIEKVRNVWINNQLPKAINTQTRTANKHKLNSHVDSPPKKMKKIDDYFKNASSLLKDVYGDQIEVLISSSSNKLITITNKEHINDKIDKVNVDLVECPNCNSKVSNKDINRHLDECLNKEIIEKLTKDVPITSQTDTGRTKDLVGKILDIAPLNDETDRIKTERSPTFENKKVTKRQTDFIIPNTEFTIKAEPGTSKDIKHEHIENKESNQKDTEIDQKCPCCGNKVDKPIVEHLDECLAFDNTTIPTEGNSAIETIIIDDDDDKFDETLTFNATGTKSPCPCCMKMIEISKMYDHLDVCLNT